MRLFKQNKAIKQIKMAGAIDPASRFEMVLELTKDLPKADFNRLIDGVKLAWQGYDQALRVKTRDEKENSDIYIAEKELTK